MPCNKITLKILTSKCAREAKIVSSVQDVELRTPTMKRSNNMRESAPDMKEETVFALLARNSSLSAHSMTT